MSITIPQVLIFQSQRCGVDRSRKNLAADFFAPTHQVLPKESAVATHDDQHVGSRAANPFYDLHQLLHRARRVVDVRRPQLGTQKMLAAENVQMQVAVAVDQFRMTAAARVHIRDHDALCSPPGVRTGHRT